MKFTQSQLDKTILKEIKKILAEQYSAQKKKKQANLLSKQSTGHGLWSAGVQVVHIQRALMSVDDAGKAKKYTDILRGGAENLKVKPDDGKYGQRTHDAIVAFQTDYPPDKYGADGLVGGFTAAQLIAQSRNSVFAKKLLQTGTALTLGARAHEYLQGLMGHGGGTSKAGVKPGNVASVSAFGGKIQTSSDTVATGAKGVKSGTYRKMANDMGLDLRTLMKQLSAGAETIIVALAKGVNMPVDNINGINLTQMRNLYAQGFKRKEFTKEYYDIVIGQIKKAEAAGGAAAQMRGERGQAHRAELAKGCDAFTGGKCDSEMGKRWSMLTDKFNSVVNEQNPVSAAWPSTGAQPKGNPGEKPGAQKPRALNQRQRNDISRKEKNARRRGKFARAGGWMFNATKEELVIYIKTGRLPVQQQGDAAEVARNATAWSWEKKKVAYLAMLRKRAPMFRKIEQAVGSGQIGVKGSDLNFKQVQADMRKVVNELDSLNIDEDEVTQILS